MAKPQIKPGALQELVVLSLRDIVGLPVTHSATAGDPPQVVVRIAEDAVHVGAYVGAWEGPHTPVAGVDLVGSVSHKELQDDHAQAVARLKMLIEQARAQRLRTFRRCNECERTLPPEWMDDDALCQSCAERNHGVVH